MKLKLRSFLRYLGILAFFSCNSLWANYTASSGSGVTGDHFAFPGNSRVQMLDLTPDEPGSYSPLTSITPAGPFCLNAANVILTASPPGGTWSGTGIVNSSTGEFSPLIAGVGSHLITYTDPSNGTATITIVVNPVPIISFISGDGTDCFGGATGSTILTVTGGTQFAGPVGCKYHYDWDWDGSPGNDSYPTSCSGGIDIEDLNNIPAGLYTVTVTDANGCSATGSALVDEPEPINLSASNVALPCYEQQGVVIDLTAGGGTPPFIYDWDWDGTAGNDDFGGDPSNTNDVQDPVIIGPGNYSVTVTDFLGCTASLTVSVTQPPELEADATFQPVLCAGGNSGSINLTVTGGTPAYTYDWDNDGVGDNDDPQDPTNLSAGTYHVTVTDANGCTATASVTVTEPSQAVTASVTSTNVSCNGDNNGAIDLTPGGGTGSYTYDWSNDGTGDNDDPQDLTNLPPGSYTVVVTDANGCTATATANIIQPPPITGNFNATICAGGSVTVNGTVYNESNPSGTEVFTAANGCDSTVTVNITFNPPLTGTFTYSGCQGDGYSVVINGTTYNESNPSGTETVTTPAGCDSIITITLTFSNTVFGQFSYTGCTGDGYSVTIGGNTYNESNPSGMTTIPSASGCDSVVTVNLTFNTETYATISNQGCQGDNFSIVVNGTLYNESNPSGTEVIENQAGCDSIITINLSFGAPSSSEITYTGCSGSGYSVVVNGTTYNESNPSGTEVLTNSVGCDSTVTITLTFIPPAMSNVNYTGCQGNGYSIVVNGTVYNENNPSGTETLTGSNGCDSMVTIQLNFLTAVAGSETYTGCTGDGYAVVVGGTTFDENNPSGTVTLTSATGCDSIVTVALTFLQPTTFDLNYQGCTGDGFSVTVNGVLYNQNNPTGTETITNQAGCDSIVNINLVFLNSSASTVSYTGCHNDGYSVLVNGVTYNEANPQGTEVIPNSQGCDSVITINLLFQPSSAFTLMYNGCDGDGYSVTVNGNIYDQNNPSGVEILTNSLGCDSIVTINLQFSSQIITTLNPLLCDGESIIVNGTLYDQNNPTGTELFTAVGGCDSIVMVELEFYPPLTGSFTPDLCEGGSIVFNGTVYDINNPSGTEVLSSSGGCDSVVTVQVNFLPVLEGLVNYQGCIGDGYFVFVNGVLYNEQNPSGTELITTAQGCDSLVTINLIFQNGYSTNIDYEGCSGDGYSVTVNNVVYNESNPNGEENLTNQAGCDSTIYINLVFHPVDTTYINTQACSGGNYSIMVNGTVYDEQNPSGTETITGVNGCDSVIIVNLSFLAGIETMLNPTICDGDSVMIAGNVYSASNPLDTLQYTALGGCDSTVYIALQVLPLPDSGWVSYSGCFGDGYSVTVNGQIYNESHPAGIEVVPSANSCDSVVTIQLEFHSCCLSDTIQSAASICAGDVYNFYGSQLSNPGSYEYIVNNANGPGCDSVFLLDLQVTNAVIGHFSRQMCEGDTVWFAGQVLNQTGVYLDTIPNGATFGCDSITELALTVNPLPQAEAGVDKEITCGAQTVILEGVIQGGTALWTGPGINGGNASQIQPAVNKTGKYILTVSSPGGCISKDSVYVTADQQTPVVDAGPDLTISCANLQTALHGVVQGQNLSWYWEGPGINAGNYSDLNPMVDSAGIYILHAVDTISHCQGLPDTIEVINMVNTIAASILTPDTISCRLRLITLDGTGSTSGSNIIYTWLDSLGGFLSNSPLFSVHTPGMFVLFVEDTLTGCKDSISVMVVDKGNYPLLDAGDDQVLNCQRDTAILDADIDIGTGSLDIHWTGPPGGFFSDTTMVPVEVGLPGWYWITVMDVDNGCTSTDSIYVDDQTQLPEAVAVVDNQIDCHHDEALIHSEHAQQGNLLDIWFDANGQLLDTAVWAQIPAPGMYKLEVHDPATGCVGEDSLMITATPAPEAAADVINETCIGDESGSIRIFGISGGTPPFQFMLNGGLPQADPLFDHLTPGAYMVQLLDANGCAWETDAFVEEGLDLVLDIGPAITLRPGETYQLKLTSNIALEQVDSLVWDPAELLSCSRCPSPILTALHPALISAIVYDQGCSDTAYVTLRIDQTYDVFIPNVFSPNDDGVNDNFTLYSSKSVRRILEMKIFDRWGNNLFAAFDFEPNDAKKGWDGRFKEKLMNPGVFVYTATVEYADGSTGQYSGDVTLVR